MHCLVFKVADNVQGFVQVWHLMLVQPETSAQYLFDVEGNWFIQIYNVKLEQMFNIDLLLNLFRQATLAQNLLLCAALLYFNY